MQKRTFQIYRYDPDKDAKPYMQTIEIELDGNERMLLDALMKLKAQDPTLSFRRSCREGVCGSDAMNINGKNGLACLTNMLTLQGPDRAQAAARPAGDPRPDRGHDAVLQAVQLDQALPGQRHDRRPRRSACSRPRSATSSTACTSASCAPAARPAAPASGGTPTSSSARPACCRPTASSPTAATKPPAERLDNLEDPYRLFRCHTIMNCVDVCPKGLNPTMAIGKIKELMVRRAV